MCVCLASEPIRVLRDEHVAANAVVICKQSGQFDMEAGSKHTQALTWFKVKVKVQFTL